MVILLLCEKTEAITLALLGLMAGWQADKIVKIIYQMKCSNFLEVDKGILLL